MLEKTIKAVLKKKIDKWIDSIPKDHPVRKTIKKNAIVAGGAITSLMQNEKPNDYDIYLKTKEAVLEVSQYYVDMWNAAHPNQTNKLGQTCKVFVLNGANPSKEILDYFQVDSKGESKAVLLSNCPPDRVKIVFPSDGVTKNESKKEVIEDITILDEAPAETNNNSEYRPVFLSSNAITLSDGIQVVIRFYGDIDEIHKNYDFEHTKSGYDYKESNLVIPKSAYECVMNKTLIYTGSLYPVCSLFRIRKFIERGWKINAGQVLKIALQVSKLDLEGINTLEDQLIGVDSLYFTAVIEHLKKQTINDPNLRFDHSYIVSIIDKIF